MKAAMLKAFGTPLTIETVPEPVLGTGEVIVDVAATRVLSYANEVLSGERKYLLDLPVIPGPGAIGRVRAFMNPFQIRHLTDAQRIAFICRRTNVESDRGGHGGR